MNVRIGQKVIDMIQYTKHQRRGLFFFIFFIKQLYKFFHIAKAAYYVVEHKKLDGAIAHGHQDPSSNITKFQYELRISKLLISWVKDQLYKGHIPKYIYDVHKNTWTDRLKHKL